MYLLYNIIVINNNNNAVINNNFGRLQNLIFLLEITCAQFGHVPSKIFASSGLDSASFQIL